MLLNMAGAMNDLQRRIWYRGAKLFGYAKRTSLIAIAPQQQGRRHDGAKHP
jgi:hypothetical protein